MSECYLCCPRPWSQRGHGLYGNVELFWRGNILPIILIPTKKTVLGRFGFWVLTWIAVWQEHCMEVCNSILMVPFKRECPSKAHWHLVWNQGIKHTMDMELNISPVTHCLEVLSWGSRHWSRCNLFPTESGLCSCYTKLCGRPRGKSVLNPSPDNPFLW